MPEEEIITIVTSLLIFIIIIIITQYSLPLIISIVSIVTLSRRILRKFCNTIDSTFFDSILFRVPIKVNTAP